MKTKLMKFAILCAIAFNLTGCVNTKEGIIVPGDSYIESNKTTKLYYEDTNNVAIKEDIKNIVAFLNKEDIKAEYLAVSKSTEEAKSYIDFKSEYVKQSYNKVLDIKFSVDEKSNYIIANKKYSSRNEAYLDFRQIWQYFFEQTNKQPELREQFNSSGDMFYIDELALNNGQLKFTTKREMARNILAEKTYKAFAYSGYQIVNDPKDADKIVCFQLTRDYKKSEYKKLQEQGKGINFGVIQSGMPSRVNEIQSSMQTASHFGNSFSSSLGIGLGVGLLVGVLTADNDPNFIIPAFKITNVKENKSYLLTSSSTLTQIANFNGNSNILTFKDEELNGYFITLESHNEGKETVKGTLIK